MVVEIEIERANTKVLLTFRKLMIIFLRESAVIAVLSAVNV